MSELRFECPLGGGVLRLTRKEAMTLRSLVRDDPRYAVLRKVMQAINESEKVTLQNPLLGLDQLRVSQGKILGVAEIARICEEDLTRWYEEGKSSEHDEETA